ncbi:MAG: glycosyltransferase 87 family protein [Acidimicrobiales bacterium]
MERPADVDRSAWLLPLAVVVGVGLRAVPFVWAGPLHVPVDYDEGAYFAAAAALARGHALYGAVSIAYPPGMAYWFAPFTVLGASTAFLAAKASMLLVAAANIWLVGRVAGRFVPRWAAAAGALVYALTPGVVTAERGVFTEPLVNLFCLLALLVWLRAGEPDAPPRRAWTAGALVGVAALFKLTALLVAVPFIVAVPRPAPLRRLGRAAGGAIAAFVLLTLPVTVRAPGAFVRQVFGFQLGRPGESTVAKRLQEVVVRFDLHSANRVVLGTVVLVAGAVAYAATRRRDRSEPAAATLGARQLLSWSLAWYVTIAIAFVASRVYFEQYNAHLAPAAGLVAAGALAALVPAARGDQLPARSPAIRWGSVSLLALVVVAGLQALHVDGAEAGGRQDDQALIARRLRSTQGCVVSFEPAWLLAADRYPDPSRSGPASVDPFAAQLGAAISAGQGSRRFDAPAAAAVARDALERCPTVVLGPRGRAQLGPVAPWFHATFHRAPGQGPGGPDVWVRNR